MKSKAKMHFCGPLHYLFSCLQARSQDCQNEETDRSSDLPLPSPLPYPLSSHPSPLLSLPLSSPSLPLEVGPLNPARGLGRLGAVSSPSGVWGGAPAEIDFGAF